MKSLRVYDFFGRELAPGLSRPDLIFLISWPPSVSRTTTACLWSIHTPALIVINATFLLLRLPESFKSLSLFITERLGEQGLAGEKQADYKVAELVSVWCVDRAK